MFLANVLLAMAWVALSGQWTLINFGLGFVLGYLLLWPAQQAAGQTTYFKRVYRAVGLTGYFIWQLILANLRVTYDILMPRRRMRPAIVAVPLDLTSPAAITLLANLITLTPGTLSLDVAPNGHKLYVHSMHVRDAGSFQNGIKEGFERYIKEIFQ